MSNDFSTAPLVDTPLKARDNAEENHKPDDLITFLCGSLAVLWKDWPKQMDITVLDSGNHRFTLRGQCPHCKEKSVFTSVTNTHSETEGFTTLFCVVMRCQGCLEYI